MLPAASASVPQLESLLGWRLVVAGRLVRTMADTKIDGLGAQALGVLLRLSQEDALTQTELARRQRVEGPSMCRMIDRLQSAGLVAREPSVDDRRAVRVTLTLAGRETVERHLHVVAEIEDEAFAALTSEERLRLADLLGKLLQGLPPAGPA